MTSTEQATRTPGSWVNLKGAIYQIDQLGEIGTCLAYARDNRVAASMVEAHNEMLAALKIGVELIRHANRGAFANGVTDSTGSMDEGNVIAEKILDEMNIAIAKAEDF